MRLKLFTSIFEPNAPAFLSKQPKTRVLSLASIIAPAHIMHGSFEQTRVHSINLKLFNTLAAPSMASISAWAVGEFFFLVRLWAMEIILPSLSTMSAPTGTSSSSKAHMACPRHNSMRYS
ncbi:MAG: hypothetical protein N2596_08945 [Syntrophorhabdaceae bacterium]|nr:hypothetical protein [Syntrophorhabdaceae bacterium]